MELHEYKKEHPTEKSEEVEGFGGIKEEGEGKGFKEEEGGELDDGTRVCDVCYLKLLVCCLMCSASCILCGVQFLVYVVTFLISNRSKTSSPAPPLPPSSSIYPIALSKRTSCFWSKRPSSSPAYMACSNKNIG